MIYPGAFNTTTLVFLIFSWRVPKAADMYRLIQGSCLLGIATAVEVKEKSYFSIFDGRADRECSLTEPSTTRCMSPQLRLLGRKGKGILPGGILPLLTQRESLCGLYKRMCLANLFLMGRCEAVSLSRRPRKKKTSYTVKSVRLSLRYVTTFSR
jgi:hypothetical protein